MRMFFNEHSVHFKVALVSIWIFPFLVLAVLTRDWLLWLTQIVGSASSVLLFALSFLLLMLIGADFENMHRMNMSVQKMLRESFVQTMVFFPGLVLVIVLGGLAAIFKPNMPNILLVGALAFLFQVLYLVSVIVLATQ
jgi:hypothetical protein